MGDKAGYAAELRKAKLEAKSKNPKQIRARARRAGGMDKIPAAEAKLLVTKPVEEWDIEELAKGRPRNAKGDFSGRAPAWITRTVHEQAMERFKELVRTDMQSHTVIALNVLKDILLDEDEDDKGKPVVSAGTKADVAKFLIEHLIGKPTQPIQADISVKLQGILGASLVMPSELTSGKFVPSSSHREVYDGEVVDPDEEGAKE